MAGGKVSLTKSKRRNRIILVPGQILPKLPLGAQRKEDDKNYYYQKFLEVVTAGTFFQKGSWPPEALLSGGFR
jgi:hypothetical protein